MEKTITTDLPQKLEPEAKNIKTPELALEAKQKLEEKNNKLKYASNYCYSPTFDNNQIKLVENSGWQVSDIWREIRVNSYCDS
ncbi:hypothetical protein [Anabaena subtropica]|uniref:Uncharacterized protein n=1 Tax=Anabaena subtropica FACHB-260 TaxID=2692884 RepID=A0ABR8CVF7_9NOST|nr:hypothetical protein [Anabaena subtropica]MBD2346212.1 hypothetical protein [Anabaena subtropica FACHB-260]